MHKISINDSIVVTVMNHYNIKVLLVKADLQSNPIKIKKVDQREG